MVDPSCRTDGSFIKIEKTFEKLLSVSSRYETIQSGQVMDFSPQQIGKWLIAAGVLIVLVGVFMIVLGKIGLFKLPGDLQFGGKNWWIYFPIVSCIIISIILTLILWLINYFHK